MSPPRPPTAIGICVAVGLVAIPLAMHFGTDKGSVAITGVGALGQVLVAVLLYYLTREQLDQSKAEASYRKAEQSVAKREHRLNDMTRLQAMFGNAKTGIGKTRCDDAQLERLDRLRDDMRQSFEQPVSQRFNRMVDSAKAARAIGVGKAGYLDKIALYEQHEASSYAEIKRQIYEAHDQLQIARSALEAL